jgi:signal transduction histidine kinase/ligand-binding sensor domain-containing protein
VTQGQDGYLWLSTSQGVYRFDGVRFQSLSEATNGAVDSGEVDGARASAFGGVWLTTRAHGQLLWKDSRVFDFPDRRCTEGRRPNGTFEDADGSLWISSSAGFAHLHQGVCEIVRAEGYPGDYPAASLMDSAGTLWIKRPTGELLYRKRGEKAFHPHVAGEGAVQAFAFLRESPNGDIWISDSHGLRNIATVKAPDATAGSQQRSLAADHFGYFVFDHDGAIWAATPQGLERFTHVADQPTGVPLSAASGEIYNMKDGLSSDNVRSLLVDREGTVWAATSSGLDRFRRNLFSTVNVPSSPDFQLAIADGNDGSIWTGSRSLPLTHIRPDGSSQIFPSTVQALAIRQTPHGELFTSGKGAAGLWQIEGTKLTPVRYPRDDIDACAAMAVDRKGDLWINTFTPALLHRVNGRWIDETANLGRRPGVIGTMANDGENNVWIAFSNWLVEWDGSSYHRYTYPDGDLNISVSTLAFGKDRVWLGGSGGIVLFHNGSFHKMRWQQETLPGRVSGLVETPEGDLWINGYSGVVHVAANEVNRWIADPTAAVNAEMFDSLDGLPGLAGERFPEPSVVRSPEGRLWFSTVRGLAWLDTRTLELRRNHLAPPVAIEAIVVGTKNYLGSAPIKLPAHTGSVQFDYTALSLAMPERVRFRYSLDRVDADWQNASKRRQAFYTNLSPGKYRFHVTASNNNGVWNDTGAFVDFIIEPAFYQMWQFRLMLGVALALLLAAMVQVRIASVTSQMRARMAARSDERERIARELHDTLLQSLFGVMLQFHSIAGRLSQQDPTRQVLSETLVRADNVMQEGRERVRNLRASETHSGSLMDELATTGYQLQALRPVGFQINARGWPRPLKPDIQEEVLLIAREALTNAFVHSQAQTISVEVIFRPRHLVILVEDNGRGIDEEILRAGGREGHWGLLGMRERARKIGSRIDYDRPLTSGTRVTLRVPARIAYGARTGWVRRIWRQLRGNF